MFARQFNSPATVAIVICAISLSLLALSIWVHLPGQVSMDASMQLYEASIGRSITWNPPYMTAILRWLGGGPVGSSWLVVLNGAVTYLSFALVASAVLLYGRGSRRSRGDAGKSAEEGGKVWLRGLAIILIMANPIVFLYVGIVWKDVLFSSLMVLGVALGLVACMAESRKAALFAMLSVVVLAVAMKVRQQGIFMSPLLLLVPILALTLGRNSGPGRNLVTALGLVALFVVSSLTMSALVARTIHTDAKYGNSVGYRGIMQYDIAGIVALSETPTEKLAVPMTENLRGHIRRLYTPDRGDFLWQSPAVTQWQALPSYDGIKSRWITLVKAEPYAFIRHKTGAFAAILNIDGVKACLPVHVGIDGNHEHLREIGFTPGVDSKDRLLYGLSQKIIRWPVFRHWVYVVALLTVAVLLCATHLQKRLKVAALVVAFATAMLYLSYLPTSIACDFRYLYAAVCLVSLLWIVALAGGRNRRLEAERP